jgi:chemotaxis protein CheD
MTFMAPISAAEQRITVMQGAAEVSDRPGTILTTILGSCVAACLYDPIARVGGMNHFLLAEPGHGGSGGQDEAFGVYLMEILINAMLKHGASRSRLRAHLYGAANFHPRMAFVGQSNAAFARQFLEQEGIPCLRADLGGRQARRVEFDAVEGRARALIVARAEETARTRPQTRPGNDVELF